MRKIVKKLLAVSLSGFMVIGMMTGCGSNKTNENTNDNTTDGSQSGDAKSGDSTATVSADETATYDIWLQATPGENYTSYSDNPVVQYLNQKFNVKLDFVQPAAGSETESLSLMLNTGEYNDLFETSYLLSTNLETLYADGAIMDLTELVKKCMPNLTKLIEENEDFRKAAYNDDGQILKLPSWNPAERLEWGGLVYRRDVLEAVTENNVVFPSGNEEPTTIEDWDYMLPLIKKGFEYAGFPEYAPLIIPYKGYVLTGELTAGFGVGSQYYLDGDTVKFGPMEDGFYNYVKKMKEWYEAGYIYKDFASRTSDPFYLPNTSLTYGAAAGIWFGLANQCGDAMSLPDYNLYVDVHAIPSPLDTEHGVTEAIIRNTTARTGSAGGYAVSSTCNDVERLLTMLDYLYSEEGGRIMESGLGKEQLQEFPNQLYTDLGLENGKYYLDENGVYHRDPLTEEGGALAGVTGELSAYRLMGLHVNLGLPEEEEAVKADKAWTTYSNAGYLPTELMCLTTEESKTNSKIYSSIDDYMSSTIPKFIMGTEELNDDTWAAFKQQLVDYGVETALTNYQASYKRYLAR